MTAGASLCAAESSTRVQRLSSTGEDLTYAHSYPQVGITCDVTFDGISAPARPHTSGQCTSQAYRSDGMRDGITHAQKHRQGLRRLTALHAVSTLCRPDDQSELQSIPKERART